MTVFIIVLTLINIGLWLVFLLKFRRLFSTDKIIEKTKARVNEIEKQINTITDRNLYIAKETKNNIETIVKNISLISFIPYQTYFLDISLNLKIILFPIL